MTEQERLRQAVTLGMKAGIWAYATWKDGDQIVGVTGRKMSDIFRIIDEREDAFWNDLVDIQVRRVLDENV